jgi:DNA primase
VAGRIPQHCIDELVARTDIIEVIGSRVQLKRAGREYKACCPFHDEKSPSFTVSADKQFYHCFGCGAHGTVLGFVMDYDHLGFIEAVEELAARAGLEIPREGGAAAPPSRGTSRPARAARSSTASTKLAWSYSIRKPSAVPCAPQPKQ